MRSTRAYRSRSDGASWQNASVSLGGFEGSVDGERWRGRSTSLPGSPSLNDRSASQSHGLSVHVVGVRTAPLTIVVHGLQMAWLRAAPSECLAPTPVLTGAGPNTPGVYDNGVTRRAISRRKLGKVLKKNVKVSAIGVYSFDGAQEQHKAVSPQVLATPVSRSS